MAEAFVELGAEGVNYVTDKHFDKIYDPVAGGLGRVRQSIPGIRQSKTWGPATAGAAAGGAGAGAANAAGATSAVSSGRPRKQRNQLPSPERDYRSDDRYRQKENYRNFDGATGARDRDNSLERQSETSERVIRAYEADPRDPTRRAETVLPAKDLRKLRRDSRMSYANGYAPSQGGGRPHSAAPPRSRYHDEDEESDYDERTGRRYSGRGRGYDDGYDRDRDDDRDYDREVVTTERYKGPYRPDFDRRQSGNRSEGGGPYGAGAVTQYRRSTNDLDEYRNRRSRSRGSRRDRDRSYSRSRSGSRDRGFKDRIEEHFDLSAKGLGAGLAGAVVGGMIGRNVGRNSRHEQRDLILGAVIGGLGANAAETKYKHWKDDKERDIERDEEKWEQKWDGGGYDRRSRSAMR